MVWLCLMALCGLSCNDDDRLPQPDRVELSFTVAVGSPATRGVLTDAEKMNTLRVIVVSKATKTIEHNKLVYVGSAIEAYTTEKLWVKANDTKTIYLLANTEDVPGLNAESITDVTALDNCVMTTPLTSNGYVPSTAVHQVEVGDSNKDLTDSPLYVVHANCKLTMNFTYTGDFTDKGITISDWKLASTADKSYLMPHINSPEDWMDVMFRDSEAGDESESDSNFKQWITDYNIPEGTVHHVFTAPEDWKLQLTTKDKDKIAGPYGPYYLHESKYLTEEANQQYQFSFKVDGVKLSATLPHLKSLVRNTHVVLNVKIGTNDVAFMVSVVPYATIALEPEFGKLLDEDGNYNENYIVTWPSKEKPQPTENALQ